MKTIRSAKFSKAHLAIVAAVIALVGTYLILSSHALPPCTGGSRGDLNCDGSVNVLDLSLLLSNYGQTNSAYDTNGDNIVNLTDMSTLLTNYNTTIATTDTTGPTTSISAPLASAVLTGTNTWTVDATDPSGVAKVDFYIDGQLQYTDTSAPYTFGRDSGGWDTTKESNNIQVLTVKAYDTLGNVANAAGVSVNVKNTITGGPGPDRGILSLDNYKPGNVWYTPLPATTPVDPNSAVLVANIQNQIQTYFGHATVNTSTYAPAIYIISGTSTPRYDVGFYNCQNKTTFDAGLKAQWLSVPIPSYANPSGGSDSEMVIFDPANKTMWEFWKAKRVNNQWYGCWGGKMANMDTNMGVFPSYYGTTATSLPFLGSTITAKELQQGEITHALAFAMVKARPGGQSWPAHRNDGWAGGTDPTTIMWEGQRARLDPSINVDSLNMTPVGKMMAKAIQKYGMVLRDKSGSVNFYAENPEPYTDAGLANPYTALFNGTASYSLLNGFPWSSLQVLPKDYGSPDGWANF